MATSRAMATVTDLRSLLETQPDLMHEVAELLDWLMIEVRELLGGEIEPDENDLLILDAFMLQHRRTARLDLVAA